MEIPQPNFAHLLALSGPLGTFEHADLAIARLEHGYCTDDVARVLLVLARESDLSEELLELARSSLHFLELAQATSGKFRNRRSCDGAWSGPSTAEDCWGRSLWALGTTFARTADANLRDEALRLFERGARVRSSWPRSMAFATLGAVEVLGAQPDHKSARALVRAAIKMLDRPPISDEWRWPEKRLSYANAVLPDALIAGASTIGMPRSVNNGLQQLRWLMKTETLLGHLSVTPVGGREYGIRASRFDQQPIEVAAMSDACVRAFDLTGEVAWIEGLELTVQWFLGDNDVAVSMFDPNSGGGYDGLTPDGPNLNQGAESTIALLTTLQHARRFAPVPS